MLVVTFILSWCTLVWANTEAYGFHIPNYYDIPLHMTSDSRDSKLIHLNETAMLIKNHPILTIDNYSTENSVLRVPYNYTSKPLKRLFVKLNNYNNQIYDSNDLINVKLCWPATTPVNFRISHRFIQERQFTGLESQSNSLDIYIVIDFEGDFHAMGPVTSTGFEILLVLSKLPNRLPIPIELYDYIVYVVDIMVLTVTVLPWLSQAFHSTIMSI
ncbi:hypothetical protein JCM33374_g1415 [Metschnikowia sp. JCM 33374]|nr:hypothetical protein JCM33374_g1415 [Metschnikowia sp. JCM 33374]